MERAAAHCSSLEPDVPLDDVAPFGRLVHLTSFIGRDAEVAWVRKLGVVARFRASAGKHMTWTSVDEDEDTLTLKAALDSGHDFRHYLYVEIK